jgi:glycosyltransferase involved in cell wall biosynthesis
MIANFWPWKNHLMLVRAAALAVTQTRDVGFVMAGRYDAYQSQVEAEIARLNLQNHFRIAGPVQSSANLLPLFDVGVLCSLPYEGFSNAILEYMAYGKPVIATCTGGLPEAVIDGETGYLIELGDAAGLSNAILRLIRDPVKQREMGHRGRARAEAEFNWESALNQWNKLLQSSLFQVEPKIVGKDRVLGRAL